MGRAYWGCVAGLMALPFVCGVAVIGLYLLLVAAVGAGFTDPPLAPWARGPILAWLQGQPQELPQDSEAVPDAAGAGVGWGQYSGPEGEIVGLPLVGPVRRRGLVYDRPPLGCRFHDPHYPQHTGVDFPVDEGTAVYAVMGGEVVWAGPHGAWGTLVVIQNGAVQVWLAHLSAVSVVPGQVVRRGEGVGWSGNTGRSTGAHLHYGIRRRTEGGSVWLDPQSFFAPDSVQLVGCY